MGTTVVKPGVVEQLKRQTDAALAKTKVLQGQVNQLQSDLRTWQSFGDAAQGLLLAGQLAGRQVVMVTVDGVDPAEIDSVRRALEQSGATVLSLMVVSPRMALLDQVARRDMAAILRASPSDPPATLFSRAARALGARLSSAPATGDADLLQQLIGAHFLALRGGSAPLQTVGTADQAVVFLAGGAQVPSIDLKGFLVPVVSEVVNANRPVVAAETADTVYPFVPMFRSDGTLDNRLVTVDDADTVPGRVAVVLGLRDLIATPGKGGDYGVKGGATGLIPRP
jgi:hypothetical protein